MKETQILFSGPMVRAILDGRKTQTRRVVKPQPFVDVKWGLTWEPKAPRLGPSYTERNVNWNTITNAFLDFYRDRGGSPYGQPGDKLWCKETWRPHDGVTIRDHDASEIEYRATDDRPKEPTYCHWKPSIFMPRWASRITLEITDVNAERLQEISAEDCIAEGISTQLREHDAVCDLKSKYRALWESINGPGSWDANPWVWVIEFRRVEK